jgi:hypothetical protein
MFDSSNLISNWTVFYYRRKSNIFENYVQTLLKVIPGNGNRIDDEASDHQGVPVQYSKAQTDRLQVSHLIPLSTVNVNKEPSCNWRK